MHILFFFYCNFTLHCELPSSTLLHFVVFPSASSSYYILLKCLHGQLETLKTMIIIIVYSLCARNVCIWMPMRGNWKPHCTVCGYFHVFVDVGKTNRLSVSRYLRMQMHFSWCISVLFYSQFLLHVFFFIDCWFFFSIVHFELLLMQCNLDSFFFF